MRYQISFAIILCIGISLQGCGRKGPLTMPMSQMPAVASAVPEVSPSSAVPAISTDK